VTVQVLQEIGFGLTKELVGIVIRDYLKDQPARPNPFHHGIPGNDWWVNIANVPHVIKDSATYKYECSGGAARLWVVSNPFPPSYIYDGCNMACRRNSLVAMALGGSLSLQNGLSLLTTIPGKETFSFNL